jgi:hypothetical protein
MKDATDLVTQPFTSTSHAQYAEGVGTLRANGGDLAGGSETLLVAPIGFSHTQGLSAQPSEAAFPTLRREGSGMAVAFATNQQAEVEEGDPMFTPNATDVHAVAYNKVIRSGARDANGELPPEVWAEQHVAPTISTFDQGEVRATTLITGPTMTVRRLTPLECERLMGWPDDWTAGQADSHRYKQCGNGVASPVAEWIARRIMKPVRGGTNET